MKARSAAALEAGLHGKAPSAMTQSRSAARADVPQVGVVLVNWRGWADTIECLESVLRVDYPGRVTVVVSDNDSGDDSVERIKAWARGTLPAPSSSDPGLRRLVTPAIPKPVEVLELSEQELEDDEFAGSSAASLILIRAAENGGFGRGCNLGLRWLLRDPDIEYCWLLNNDTVIEAGALTPMVERLRRRPDKQICGSTLLYYESPGKIQALGTASFNQWLALSKHLGGGRLVSDGIDVEEVRKDAAYVVGASMLIDARLLRRIGLLSEDYFLFFEELDLVSRAGGRAVIDYAPESVVYHKEGGSVGSGTYSAVKAARGDYYWLRSRILYTWRHARYAIPFVYLAMLGSAINRLRRRQPDRAFQILKLMLNPGRSSAETDVARDG